MKKPIIVAAVSVLLSLIVGVSPVHAQSVTTVNDLNFGDGLPGVPKTVSKVTPGAAAEYSVSGTAGEEVLIDFTLPSHLTHNSDLLLISFSTTDCAIDSSDGGNQSNPAWNNQNPHTTLTATLGTGGLTIWLGGTISPKFTQPQGAYSGSIIVTVSPSGT